MRVRPAALFCLLLGTAGRLAAQSGGSRSAIVVLDLQFDGEHANVLEPGDTAVATAATRSLRATLEASAGIAVLDSGRVAQAARGAAGDGNPCDNACALSVARQLGARWVAKGTVTKTSNLVWVLSAQLIETTTGKAVLSDSYELKGDATRMAPAGAHVFAERVTKAVGGGPRASRAR